jgi:hypothetical protein
MYRTTLAVSVLLAVVLGVVLLVVAGCSKQAEAAAYTCPMHPEVTSDKPGKCPQCGMELVPKQQGAPTTAPTTPAPPGGEEE